MAHDLAESNLTLNLVAEKEQGGGEGTDVDYAFGFRPDTHRRLGWGIEGQGLLEHGGNHEILVGLYGQPKEQVTLKIGLGAGLGPEAPDLTARAGVVWRF